MYRLNQIVSYLLFSNIYLGIIAVALCVESNLMSGLSLNYFPFYIVTFLGTCLYYTFIYVRSVKARNYNDRTVWYRKNLPVINKTIRYVILAMMVVVAGMIVRNRHHLLSLSWLQLLTAAVFPLLAIWYTYAPPMLHIGKIRQLGLLKPFIIGLTWMGFVTCYPVFLWQIQKQPLANPPLYPSLLLCLLNFIYITILAIIFDVKDWRNDRQQHLNTFAVVLGIRRTMYGIALPLFCINAALLAVYQYLHAYQPLQMVLQWVPYVLLLVVIITHQKPKSLLYYLAAVDGLMLIKAVCGILSISLFK